MNILESFKVTADALIDDLENSFNDVFKSSKKSNDSSEYLRGQSESIGQIVFDQLEGYAKRIIEHRS